MPPELTFERLAPGQPVSGDRRSGGRRPPDAQRPRPARDPLRREDVRSPKKTLRPSCAAGRPWRRAAPPSRWATRSRSTPCSPEPAKRCGPTCSTCAWRSTSWPRVSPARSSSRWRSSASASGWCPTRKPGSSACALPGSYEIAHADRWLAERASAAAALAPVLSAELAARPELERLYREIERPLTPVLARMERAGRRDRQPASRRDLETDGGRAARLSSRGSGPRPARNST